MAMAMIGFSKSASVIPVARHSERAPAMFRPWVDVRLRYPLVLIAVVCRIFVTEGKSATSLAQDALNLAILRHARPLHLPAELQPLPAADPLHRGLPAPRARGGRGGAG